MSTRPAIHAIKIYYKEDDLDGYTLCGGPGDLSADPAEAKRVFELWRAAHARCNVLKVDLIECNGNEVNVVRDLTSEIT